MKGRNWERVPTYALIGGLIGLGVLKMPPDVAFESGDTSLILAITLPWFILVGMAVGSLASLMKSSTTTTGLPFKHLSLTDSFVVSGLAIVAVAAKIVAPQSILSLLLLAYPLYRVSRARVVKPAP